MGPVARGPDNVDATTIAATPASAGLRRPLGPPSLDSRRASRPPKSRASPFHPPLDWSYAAPMRSHRVLLAMTVGSLTATLGVFAACTSSNNPSGAGEDSGLPPAEDGAAAATSDAGYTATNCPNGE